MNSLLAGKVDNSRVLTDVPANGLLTATETTYSAGTGHDIEWNNLSYVWYTMEY